MIGEALAALGRWFRDDASPTDQAMAVVLAPPLAGAVYAIVTMLIRG